MMLGVSEIVTFEEKVTSSVEERVILSVEEVILISQKVFWIDGVKVTLISEEKVTLIFQVISEGIDEGKPHVKVDPPSQGQRAQVQLAAPVEPGERFVLEAEQVVELEVGQAAREAPVVPMVEPGAPVVRVAQAEAPVEQAQVEAPVGQEVQVGPVEQVEPVADVCTYV